MTNKMDVLDNIFKIYEEEISKYKEFISKNGYTPYDSKAFVIAMNFKTEKLKNKISAVSLLITLLGGLIIVAFSLLYTVFFGAVEENSTLVILITTNIAIVIFVSDYLNKKIKYKIYKKIFNISSVRYLCFTKNFKMIVSTKDNDSFTIEKEYTQFSTCFITNIGWSTSFKVMGKNKELRDVYEILNMTVNNFPSLLHIFYIRNNPYSFWKMDDQLEYFKKNGSNLEYVDDILIINNTFKKAQSNKMVS